MEHIEDLNKYHIGNVDMKQIEAKPESTDQLRDRVMNVFKKGNKLLNLDLDNTMNQAYLDKKKHREKKRKKKTEEEKKDVELVTVSIRPSPFHVHYS